MTSEVPPTAPSRATSDAASDAGSTHQVSSIIEVRPSLSASILFEVGVVAYLSLVLSALTCAVAQGKTVSDALIEEAVAGQCGCISMGNKLLRAASPDNVLRHFGRFLDGGSTPVGGRQSTGNVDAGDKLGTLWGVFIPTAQNLLGITLFLRVPWITAQAGVPLATIVVLCCAGITTLTTLALSAIASNGAIKGGGPYYIISRSLGKELGAAMGILFYLATTAGGSMYALGAVEAFQDTFSLKNAFIFDMQLQAIVLMFALSIVVMFGLKPIKAAGGLFMVAVIVAVISYFTGISLFIAGRGLESSNSFVSLIAIYFPAVTDLMAGTAMSAVLRTPSRSIPVGTLTAVLSTTVVYIVTVWVFGLSVSNATLKTNKLVVAAAAFPHPLVVALGVMMSSVGACIQCLVAGPQVLTAIAEDEVIPGLRFLVPTNGASGNEGLTYRALWFTFLLASLPALAGNLDFIAPLISMFYLLMYASVNAACFTLELLALPGFRPRWRYHHWSLSLLGFAGCVTMMILMSWYAAIAAIAASVLLYIYASRVGVAQNWGDAKQGLRFQVARDALLALEYDHSLHPKNWRPQLLVVFKVDAEGEIMADHHQLLHVTEQLHKGKGLNMVTGVLHVPSSGMSKHEIAAALDLLGLAVQRHMQERGVQGFASVLAADDWHEGIWMATQQAGLGALRPNIVMLHSPTTSPPHGSGGSLDAEELAEQAAEEERFVDTVRTLNAAGRSVLLVQLRQGASMPVTPCTGTIDVWWIVHDGGLLMLLSHLLHRHHVWRSCKLRLYSIVAGVQEDTSLACGRLKQFLASVRIKADVHVLAVTDELLGDWCDALQRPTELGALTMVLTPGARTLESPAVAMLRGRTHSHEERTSHSPPRAPREIEISVMGSTPPSPSRVHPLATAGDGGLVGSPVSSDIPLDEHTEHKAVDKQMQGPTVPTVAPAVPHAEAEAKPGMQPVSHLPTVSEEHAPDTRLATARVLNSLIRKHSAAAQLVVTNLLITEAGSAAESMEYVRTLTHALKRVLLVRGAGHVVVTEYG